MGYSKDMDPLALLQQLVNIPAPPGQEGAMATELMGLVHNLGRTGRTDPKGNVVVELGGHHPVAVVTAHMDEIALIVRQILPDGSLLVGPLGGLYPWKIGEGPVHILGARETVNGILSIGAIHTEDRSSVITIAKGNPLTWDMMHVLTGQSPQALLAKGVRPGTRVVVSPSRRKLETVGEWIAGPFLDDRADLVSWLLALAALEGFTGDVTFLASAAEEVGGEGALYYLQTVRPEICIALELGPHVPDAPVLISPHPTLWVNDGYSAMRADDIAWVTEIAESVGISLQYQAMSRGGSDASCAASHGLCARPITIGLPMANSHGFEVMHPEAMTALAVLTEAIVRHV